MLRAFCACLGLALALALLVTGDAGAQTQRSRRQPQHTQPQAQPEPPAAATGTAARAAAGTPAPVRATAAATSRGRTARQRAGAGPGQDCRDRPRPKRSSPPSRRTGDDRAALNTRLLIFAGLLVAVGLLLFVAFAVQALYLWLALRAMRRSANLAERNMTIAPARLRLRRVIGMERRRRQRQDQPDLGQQRRDAGAEPSHQHQLEGIARRAAGRFRLHLCPSAGPHLPRRQGPGRRRRRPHSDARHPGRDRKPRAALCLGTRHLRGHLRRHRAAFHRILLSPGRRRRDAQQCCADVHALRPAQPLRRGQSARRRYEPR